MKAQQLYMKPETEVDLNFVFSGQSYRIHVNSCSGVILFDKLIDGAEPESVSIILLRTLTEETKHDIIKTETEE